MENRVLVAQYLSAMVKNGFNILHKDLKTGKWHRVNEVCKCYADNDASNFKPSSKRGGSD